MRSWARTKRRSGTKHVENMVMDALQGTLLAYEMKNEDLKKKLHSKPHKKFKGIRRNISHLFSKLR